MPQIGMPQSHKVIKPQRRNFSLQTASRTYNHAALDKLDQQILVSVVHIIPISGVLVRSKYEYSCTGLISILLFIPVSGVIIAVGHWLKSGQILNWPPIIEDIGQMSGQ